MKMTAWILAAAAAAVIAGSGVSLAAGENKKADTPKVGTWEYNWAIETGKLPVETVKPAGNPVPDTNVKTVEIGGRSYRLGVDAP